MMMTIILMQVCIALRFPVEDDYQKKWLAACGLNFVPKNSGVCQAHFAAEAYYHGCARLIKDALPYPNVSFDQNTGSWQ